MLVPHPYVRDPETGESITRQFLVRLFSTAGGPVDLPDGSSAPASLSTVLSPSVPVGRALYEIKGPKTSKCLRCPEPDQKECGHRIGRASRTFSAGNRTEELWCLIADVSQACKLLTPLEREVLRYRFFHDYEEDRNIASALDLPMERVPELERSALDRLVSILDNMDE